MKKFHFLLIIALISSTALAQNVGIGTNSPKEKLHIAGGNVLIEDGIVARSSTGAKRDLLPVALATISFTGTVTDGTSNVSCTKDGNEFIVDIGMKNTNCQVFITLLPGVATHFNVYKMTGSNDTKFRVVPLNANDVAVSSSFSLVVFKAGNDPHYEYNITVATNMNGIRIGHGYNGINAYGVDSVTINITVLAGVTLGGPDPDTANLATGAINIMDIPCPASITINNYGRIVGRGGRGGRGGGTYQTASPNTNNCTPAPVAGQPGGDAIYTEKRITVNNFGYMAGGGGGGGGGKAGAAAGSNGGGGGTGAGWPLVAGGQGGGSFYSQNPLGSCPPGGTFTGCLTQPCCCGAYAPFGANGNGNSLNPNGNALTAGSGGAGVNGGFQGFFGGAIALAGGSNGNTAPGGPPGKVIRAKDATAAGNVVISSGGGSYAGVVD